jgi:hypothetical protein
VQVLVPRFEFVGGLRAGQSRCESWVCRSSTGWCSSINVNDAGPTPPAPVTAWGVSRRNGRFRRTFARIELFADDSCSNTSKAVGLSDHAWVIALVPLRGKVYCQASRFPDCHHLAGRSPALAPALIKARVPRNQAAMITSPRSAPPAGLLQRVREQYQDMPGLKLTKAAGHAVVWGNPLGVRRDAQGTRDGELSVSHRRRPFVVSTTH